MDLNSVSSPSTSYGDGVQDLAVANDFSNNVSVPLGSGNGTFQAAQIFGASQLLPQWTWAISMAMGSST